MKKLTASVRRSVLTMRSSSVERWGDRVIGHWCIRRRNAVAACLYQPRWRPVS